MEWLGRGSQQQPVSASSDGRIDAGPGAPVAAEMGIRISRQHLRPLPSQPLSAVCCLSGAAIARSTRLTQKADAPAGRSRPRRSVRTAISLAPISGTDQFAVFFGDRARQCLRRERDDGRIDLEDEGRGSSGGPDHRCANPVFRRSVCAGFVDSRKPPGRRPAYQCCTFRGSVVALDSATGKQIWKAYTIPEAPRPTKRNAIGTQLYGPSGAAVWSAPTIDVQRQALYVATGDNYSEPAIGNERCNSCV